MFHGTLQLRNGNNLFLCVCVCVCVQIGNENFLEVVSKIRGPQAVQEWKDLQVGKVLHS